MRKLILFVTVITIGLFLVSCGGSTATTPAPPSAPVATPATPAIPATPPAATAIDAKALYTQNCAACHGQNREGLGTTFPPLTPTSLKDDSVAEIADIITNGSPTNPVMAAWKGKLSSTEIDALTQFVKNVAP